MRSVRMVNQYGLMINDEEKRAKKNISVALNDRNAHFFYTMSQSDQQRPFNQKRFILDIQCALNHFKHIHMYNNESRFC